jgi:hypothetical protein
VDRSFEQIDRDIAIISRADFNVARMERIMDKMPASGVSAHTAWGRTPVSLNGRKARIDPRAAAGSGRVWRWRDEIGGRFNSDADHFGLIAGDFDLVLAGRKIELAFFEHHRVIASNRPLVCIRGCRRAGRHSPANCLADVINAAGVIRREGELLLDRRSPLGETERGSGQDGE